MVRPACSTSRPSGTAARNTLLIALLVTFVSLVLGTTSALALHRFVKSRLQRFHYTLIYTPLVVPEILMGISLLMAFVAAGVKLGMLTIILAHVTFCISYVALIVLGRLAGFRFLHRRGRPRPGSVQLDWRPGGSCCPCSPPGWPPRA